MGRKKSKRIVSKRRVATLPSKHDCPKCNHENVVSCKLNRKYSVGSCHCSVCESTYKCEITQLDQTVDVYHKWVDELQ